MRTKRSSFLARGLQIYGASVTLFRSLQGEPSLTTEPTSVKAENYNANLGFDCI